MFIEQNRFANCKYKNGSGCKISAKSEKLQYFALLGSKFQTFSKWTSFSFCTQTVLGTKFQPNLQIAILGSKLLTFQKWTSFSNYMRKNCSGYKISAKSEKLQYFALLAILGSKLQTFQKWTSFSNYMHKNCSGYKISTKSEKLQYFALLVSKLQTFQ